MCLLPSQWFESSHAWSSKRCSERLSLVLPECPGHCLFPEQEGVVGRIGEALYVLSPFLAGSILASKRAASRNCFLFGRKTIFTCRLVAVRENWRQITGQVWEMPVSPSSLTSFRLVLGKSQSSPPSHLPESFCKLGLECSDWCFLQDGKGILSGK